MLLYLNIGGAEWLLILVALVMVIALGNYGKGTWFGYWGSIFLSLAASPILAFIILYFIKKSQTPAL